MSDPMRRAIIQLTEQDAAAFLDLPDGYQVLHVGGDWLRSSVVILINSDELDRVQPGCEPPLLHGAFNREQVVVDGKVYYRWSWQPEQAG